MDDIAGEALRFARAIGRDDEHILDDGVHITDRVEAIDGPGDAVGLVVEVGRLIAMVRTGGEGDRLAIG